MKTWSNGKIINGRKNIDSLNFSLHYANPVIWEGIRTYRQSANRRTTKIWKLEEHINRLFDSAKIINTEIPYNKKDLVAACQAVTKANGNGDFYLRPIVYSSQDAESAKAKQSKISVDIYCFPIPALYKPKNEGIKVKISNIIRSYPQFQMQAKTSANYSMLHPIKNELAAGGIDDLLVTDNQGYIVEATVANIWVFKGDLAMTPPNNGSILPGITRQCVMNILKDAALMKKYGLSPYVIEKNITKADLYTADCVVLCGTYAEIVNVAEIDGRQIGDQQTRSYYKILHEEYGRMVRAQ
ncbi:MAG: aminotransferase class IV [Candidatus Niyogibacteria bacterium]|nr:aminotransferase class IV [Candidatus Niyogibacteria bacterium]